MKCPYCNHADDAVLDSRPLDSATVIRRRRICKGCQKRFTTYERLEEMPLMVVKSDARREPYDRNKLRQGLMRACEKRPISIDTIDNIVAEVEYDLKDYVMEIPSRAIGEKVLKKLYAIDPVAYVRFASVYRNFSDIDSFWAEIKKLKSKRPKTANGNGHKLPGEASLNAELEALRRENGAKNGASGQRAVKIRRDER